MTREGLYYRFSQLVWLVFGAIEGLIGLRVLLKLVGANPANPFADWIYTSTDLLLGPFLGLTRTPAANGIEFDIPALIGMLVYMLLAWGLIQLVEILVGPPKSVGARDAAV